MNWNNLLDYKRHLDRGEHHLLPMLVRHPDIEIKYEQLKSIRQWDSDLDWIETDIFESPAQSNRLMKNNFPYWFDPKLNIEHWNLWSRTQLSTAEIEQELNSFHDNKHDVIWFVNPIFRQSLPHIFHVHVFRQPKQPIAFRALRYLSSNIENQLVQLHNMCFPLHLTKSMSELRGCFCDPLWFVAYDHEKMVGMCAVGKVEIDDRKELFVYNTAIHPDYRKRHTGTKMAEFIMQEISSFHENAHLYLWRGVVDVSNHDAYQFFLSIGATETSRDAKYIYLCKKPITDK